MPYIVTSNNKPKIVHGWPVIIPEATDGGRVTESKTTWDFEIITQSEHDAIVKRAVEKEGNADTDLMLRVVKGWEGMVDEDKAEIPFSLDALEDVAEKANVRAAFMTEYMGARAGRKATRKN